MIPVTKQPEPADFDSKVRQPGLEYLVINPKPNSKQWPSYWSHAKSDLYKAYGKICAYSCFYLVVDDGSVDHFLPKSLRPDLAYEWDNYRLAGQRINTNKANSIDVIDPFNVEIGWFVIDFPSCLVKVGSGLSQSLIDQIQKTICALKLNHDDFFVQKRSEIMMDYADGEITLSFLQKRFPFIASEILRQNITQNDAQALFKKRAQ